MSTRTPPRSPIRDYMADKKPPLGPRLFASILVMLFGGLVTMLALVGWLAKDLSWMAAVPPLVIGLVALGIGVWIAIWAIRAHRHPRA